MRTRELLQALRTLKHRDVMSRWEAEEMSEPEAAELLGTLEWTSGAGRGVTRPRAARVCPSLALPGVGPRGVGPDKDEVERL